jgi:hypothetical protein
MKIPSLIYILNKYVIINLVRLIIFYNQIHNYDIVFKINYIRILKVQQHSIYY